ncbi:MAG TPA: DUF2007 domain-containing protein [Gammaproteobacteria bacterium]|nr:DUF2007 domain-containing protein [Gammaproteobacteria bacterium]
MKLVYTNENRFLVNNAKNILENAGIAVTLTNEYAAGGTGALSPFDTWVELWVVNDSDYEDAVRAIEASPGPEQAGQWKCDRCGEANEPSFEFCWNCRREKP